jgi:hypothetical protein
LQKAQTNELEVLKWLLNKKRFNERSKRFSYGQQPVNLCACPVKCRAYFTGIMLKKLIRQSSVANKSSEYYTYAGLSRSMALLFFSHAFRLRLKATPDK